jgi:hypothetical protein
LSNQVATDFTNAGLPPAGFRFGRWPPTPVFARSPEITAVNGTPDRTTIIVWICQPPSTLFTSVFE